MNIPAEDGNNNFGGKLFKHIKMINNKIIQIVCCMSVFVSCLTAQNSFLKTKDAYLGQKPPGETPEIFAKGMLIDSGIVLGKVQFSKDGKAFYYSFARHWFDSNGSGTREILFDGKTWQKPRVIAENHTNPALSPDEKSLYLGGKGSTVWQLEKTENGWTAPALWLESPQYGLYNFQSASNGTFYMGSNGMQGSKNDYATYDFCKMVIIKGDTTVQSLGNVLNTPAFDGDFFIAPDESYIIISTKETKNYECELWISFRKKDGTWSAPQSLGDKINNGLAHRFGQYVSPDGKYLFYTYGTSEADCNIYWVRIDKTIARLKKTAK